MVTLQPLSEASLLGWLQSDHLNRIIYNLKKSKLRKKQFFLNEE